MTERFTIVPFLLAMLVAVADMPTNVYQVCRRSVGTLEIEPWKERASNGIKRTIAAVSAFMSSLLNIGVPALCAAAAILALMVADLNAAHGIVLMAVPPLAAGVTDPGWLVRVGALNAERATLLQECEEINTRNFSGEGDRESMDAKLERIKEIDQAKRGISEGLVAGTDAIRTEVNSGAVFGYQTDGRSEIKLMAEALSARFGGPPPSEAARQFAYTPVVDMARSCLAARGVSTRLMPPQQLVQRALHTTSDFPALLAETGNRSLRRGYESYQGGVRRICKESSAPNFRAKSKLMLGEAPTLLKVLEHGEVTRGTMVTYKESYSLETFARIFGITRQALVNDDLSAFSDMAAGFGRAAAEFIAAQLTSKLTSNPTMSDSVALFHADHSNLGTTGAISIASLTEALKMMRLQKGLDGVTVIDVTPKYLVVPAAKEVIARQFVAQINATTASDVNPFSAELEVVVDPRLDAASGTAWYLAADPAAFDTIEYSFLEGEPGPQIETRAGFDIEGMEMKVRLDFGCGVVDWRGLFKNAGA